MKLLLQIIIILMLPFFIIACAKLPLALPENNEENAKQPETVAESNHSALSSPALPVATTEVIGGGNRSPLATPTITVPLEPTNVVESPTPVPTPTYIEAPFTPPPPPPTFTPVPTPTATPTNPNETVIDIFDMPIGSLDISPDDQTLALIALGQIWMVEIEPQNVDKLDISGAEPKWSPDGEQILFRSPIDIELNRFSIETMNRDGANRNVVDNVPRDDLLDYYWLTNEKVAVVKPDGIYKINLSNRSVDQVSLTIPARSIGGNKSQVTGRPSDLIIVSDSRNLWSLQGDTQSRKIVEVKSPQSIVLFKLSPDENQIAYVTADGPSEELWIVSLDDNPPPSKFYHLDRGHIRALVWSPDSNAVVVGWRSTGTSLGGELTLFWLDTQNGKTTPLRVHGVGKSVIFNHRGDRLFYERTIYADPTDEGKSTLYYLSLKS